MLHVSVPPVGLTRFMVFASGFAPPAVPEKLRLVGFRAMLAVVVVVALEVVVVLPGGVVVPVLETTNVTGIVAV